MQKIALFIALVFSGSLFAQNAEQTYQNPVIQGDFPDATIIRVGSDYYASGSTSDMAPNYPLYHSTDLVNWERIGDIFNTPPAWIKGDCWAPELYYNNGVYFAYYTARKKSDNISCIGVATTTDITKGFEDQGILIEWGSEAIDAYVFKDTDQKLYITWKAYGLDPNRPIEILASELSADGLSLIGQHFTLTHHDKNWIGSGDEGQCIVKHGEYYYMLYSIGGCCDTRCDYRVCVARSKSIRGQWEQKSAPILQGGNLWKCSGHGTLVQTPDGRDFYLYHAYHKYDFEFVGRQGLLDELRWDEDTKWPYFRYGDTPSLQAELPFKNTVQKRNPLFYDNFATDKMDKYWLWDMNLPQAKLSKNSKGLMFENTGDGICFRGINPQTGNYTMETAVHNTGENLKGLSVYGNSGNLFAWGIENSIVKLYQWKGGIKTELFNYPLNGIKVFLKVESINAKSFRFLWSTNNDTWQSFPTSNTIDGSFIPQWGKGVRAGLLIDRKGDGKGQFSYFSLSNR